MADVYKTLTYDQVKTRTTRAISSEDKTKIDTVVSNFISFFKAKHS